MTSVAKAANHLAFLENGTSDSGKTKIWDVVSNHTGEVIGHIKWHGAWRKYVFFPDPNTLWDVSCLSDILEFIKRQMELRKES